MVDEFDWLPCASAPSMGGLQDHLALLDGAYNQSATNCSLLDATTAVQVPCRCCAIAVPVACTGMNIKLAKF